MNKRNILLSAMCLYGMNAYAAAELDINPTVVGGIETPAYSRPYQVALLMNGRQGCGGTLIDPNWVLTAAHCLDNASTSSLTVRVGAHSISRNDGVTLRVSQIINHERWNGANGIRSGYDIAVLKLASPAPSQYTPAKLPTAAIESQYASPGDYVTVSGWGLTSNRGRPSDVLREADLPVITNSSCSSQLSFNLPSSVICGGGEGGRSACNGDSGGPYAVRVGNDFYSIGTVSWGQGCQGATAFTRTTSFLNWIKQKTGIIDGEDKKPVANFEVQTDAASLTASFTNKSTDDKGITGYQWSFGQGNAGSTQTNPSFTYASAGSYNVTLTVTDTIGQTSSVSKVVNFIVDGECNAAPWSATQSYALGDKVSYKGYEYESTWWSQGAQPDLYSNVWRRGAKCDGNVEDPAPVADFSVATEQLTATLTSTSTDNGQIVSTRWIVNGESYQGSVVSHTFAQAGSYSVTLSVTDDKGQTAQKTKTISVSENVDTCKGTPAWSESTVYLQGQRVSLNGVIYEAKWWVQGENPASSGPWGPWKTIGLCS